MNAYQVVKDFEKAIADFTGAPFAVSVESCSAAIFLCCLFYKVKNISEVMIPKFTYPSVPASIVNAGGRVIFKDISWQKKGWYRLNNTIIIDSAKKLSRCMYIPNRLICLSFHANKPLGIGRGGMILTDYGGCAEWLRLARFDGRHGQSLSTDVLQMPGWNMYMTPEQAARGLELLQWLPPRNVAPPDPYQDLSKYGFYMEANR